MSERAQGSGGPTIVPPPAEDAPRVGAALEGLGLGTWVPGGPRAFGGRNENWAGETTSGTWVFVKDTAVEPDEAHDEHRRSLAFERVKAAAPDPPRSPAFLGHHGGMLVHELLPDVTTASELVSDGRLDEETCHATGRELARTHALDPGSTDLDTGASMLPALDWLSALPWSVYRSSSMAQLQALRLMQDDEGIHGPLRLLRAQERRAERRPVHGDLRLDQVLVSQGEVYLCDWEEFRLGDPARDLGTLVGELVYAVALDLVDRHAVVGGAARPDDVVDRGVEALRRVRPVVVALVTGYSAGLPLDDDLAVRSVRFAGWHMYDRLYVAARERSRLSSLHLAAAGMGRLLMADPGRFVRTVGVLA